MTDPVWTEERIARLRELWPTGLSTAKIGQILGVTKNAVVGKVNRMADLERRPSPIKHGTSLKPTRVLKPKKTLPPLPSEPPAEKRIKRMVAQSRESSVIHSMAQFWLPRVVPLPATTHSFYRTCQFPTNDGERMQWTFCDDPTQPGSSYCPAHHRLCYRRSAAQVADAAD